MTRRILGTLADSGPVVVPAGIAAAGSFTHIRDTATEHGQHGWTQADPSVWGWITAGTPAGAFLVAVSMLERRKAGTRAAACPSPRPAADVMPVPDSFGHPSPSPSSSGSSSGNPSSSSPSSPWVVWERPTAAPAAASVQNGRDDQDQDQDEQDGQTSIPVPANHPASTPSASSPSASSSSSAPAGPLVDFARRVAAEHESEHGRPITRDALRARLGVSNQLASDLLRQLRTETASLA